MKLDFMIFFISVLLEVICATYALVNFKGEDMLIFGLWGLSIFIAMSIGESWNIKAIKKRQKTKGDKQ